MEAVVSWRVNSGLGTGGSLEAAIRGREEGVWDVIMVGEMQRFRQGLRR